MSPLQVSAAALLETARKGESVPRVDSRAIKAGDIFVALPPATPGGKGCADYAADAVAAGAAAIVCDGAAAERVRGLLDALRADSSGGLSPALCVVENSRYFLGELAAAWFGTEKYRPCLVGITGTNGKTTSAYLLEAVLSAVGRKVGVLGTISYRWPGFSRPAPLTTPGCLELHGLFAGMRDAGVDTVIMEVSSHALDQERVAALDFSAALLTNVTQDHLDYHKDMEAYFQAKARLFLPPDRNGVPRAGKFRAVNLNDGHGRRLYLESLSLPGRLAGFGLFPGVCPDEAPEAPVLRGRVLEASPDGLLLEQRYGGRAWPLRSPLVGAFNAMNLLGVQAVALGLGLKTADLQVLENFHGVPGRLERIPNNKGLNVFVDYAHTPDALTKATGALREAGFTRVITLFGCGGNRDRSKRPLMGQAVCAGSDVGFLTSDNPRHEDPRTIMDDVLKGVDAGKEFYEDADRKSATGKALELLAASSSPGGSALLVAGKGHEDYQIIGDRKFHYSDQEVIRELLSGRTAEAGGDKR